MGLINFWNWLLTFRHNFQITLKCEKPMIAKFNCYDYVTVTQQQDDSIGNQFQSLVGETLHVSVRSDEVCVRAKSIEIAKLFILICINRHKETGQMFHGSYYTVPRVDIQEELFSQPTRDKLNRLCVDFMNNIYDTNIVVKAHTYQFIVASYVSTKMNVYIGIVEDQDYLVSNEKCVFVLDYYDHLARNRIIDGNLFLVVNDCNCQHHMKIDMVSALNI